MKLCKSCPDSEDYSPDLDVLYNEWETKKKLEGKIPDIAGGKGESQQDSTASEQNLEQEA
jgi:hypothetical protein